MVGAGSYFTLCPRNYFILTQYNTDNPVTNLDSVVGRDFPDILVSTSVFSTSVASPALCHS